MRYVVNIWRNYDGSLIKLLHLSSGQLSTGKWPNTFNMGTRKHRWLMNYAKNQFADSSPDEVIEIFSNYLILPAAPGPRVDLASNRNQYHMVFWG
jgi:hypothetical protein